MGQGATNKRKGSNAEREYAQKFRDLGFDKCMTSRLGSRFYDNCGIDLFNLPFNVQIKAGIQKGLNPSKLINEIKETISKNFMNGAPEHEAPLIVIHRKQGKPGKKRIPSDDLVHMTFTDLEKLINMIEWKQ